MRILILVLLLLLGWFQYRLWVGEGSLAEVAALRHEILAQGEEMEKLRTRNRRLQAEVEDLRQGQDALEERARSELGMIKEGEIFLQVIEPQSPVALAGGEGKGPLPAGCRMSRVYVSHAPVALSMRLSPARVPTHIESGPSSRRQRTARPLRPAGSWLLERYLRNFPVRTSNRFTPWRVPIQRTSGSSRSAAIAVTALLDRLSGFAGSCL